jgi:hypothetical protein
VSRLTNPKQFGETMSAHDILGSIEMAPGKDLHKASEAAWASGLGGDIKKNWVTQPLTIWHEGERSRLADGHHRLAVAHDIDPARQLPVRHQYRD